MENIKQINTLRNKKSTKTIECRKKCSKKNTACIIKECQKVDTELWILNWKYNKLQTELKIEIIKIAIEHGIIDNKLFNKVKKMFLNDPKENFDELFYDIDKNKNIKTQCKKKITNLEKGIKLFTKMEQKKMKQLNAMK